MNARKICSHVLVIVGLVAMLFGALDPLEGSFVILPGSGMVALGTLIGKTRYRLLFCSAFVLVAIGIGAMFILSMFGGVGGNSGHSLWWLLVVLPYPVGWIAGLAGVVALVGKGWQRILVCCGVILVVTALAALITLFLFRGMGHGAPSGFWLVIASHFVGCVVGLAGAVLWLIKSFRSPAP